MNTLFDKNQKVRYRLCITLIFAVIAGMLIYMHGIKDGFYYNFRGYAFLSGDNSTSSVNEENGVLTVTDVKGDATDVTTPALTLQKGEYNFDFQYILSGAESVTFTVSSDVYLNEDNTVGKNFYSTEITSDLEGLAGKFELPADTENVVFSVKLPEGATLQIGRLTLDSDTVYVNDYLLLAFLMGIIYLTVMYIAFIKKDNELLYVGEMVISNRRATAALFAVMLAAAVFLTYPLFSDSIPAGCDLLYHMNRIEGIAQGLSAGQFPVRIHPQHLQGYGYANSIFYPELFLYIPAVMRLAGVSLVFSYTAFVFIVNMATIFVGYISFRKLFNSKLAGLFTALIYAMNPYRLATIYDRSAVGEFLAMIFIPMVFYGVYAVIFGNKNDWKLLCIGATGVFQSHIITTEIVAVFCVAIAIVGLTRIFGKDRRLFVLIKSVAFTLLLNIWFIVPLLLMTLQLNVAVFNRSSNLANHSISSINELFSTLYLTQFRENAVQSAPSGLGLIFMASFVVFILCIILFEYDKQSYKGRLISMGKFMAVIAAVTIICSTEFFPWTVVQRIPVVSKLVGVMQFPSRMFSITMLAFSVIMTVTVIILTADNRERVFAMICLTLLMLLSSGVCMDTVSYYPRSQYTGDKYHYFLDTYGVGCISQGEYVPAATSIIDLISRNDNIEVPENVEISNLSKNGTTIDFDYRISDYNESENYTAVMPLTMYPTYVAEINGKKYETFVSLGNYVRFDLAEGSGHVSLSYRQPKLFILSGFISVISSVVFLAWDKIKYKK